MIIFATLKLFVCIHCCHTTYTFLLILNPLKMFRRPLYDEHFSDFFGDYRAFWCANVPIYNYPHMHLNAPQPKETYAQTIDIHTQ